MTIPTITGVEMSRRHRRIHWRCPACRHRHITVQDIHDDAPLTVACTRSPHPAWTLDPWERP